ncbi:MAG: hypothetical protein A2381_15245 [Bdellovibrionales bacterium RIFOXYB1_FULL_37_110]|nr:MAG: hypothetical protein A2381_15245 [Bdellovibrionales bacterium RIFOXYB1_FULL_37_110]
MGNLCKTGKARQIVYDAIKYVRETGESKWVTFGKKRIKIYRDKGSAYTNSEPPDSFEFVGNEPCGWHLVKHHGRVILTDVYSKDYTWCYPPGSKTACVIRQKDLLAYVHQIYDRNSED